MTDDSYPDDVREIDGTDYLKKFVYQCRQEGFDPDNFERMIPNNFRQSGCITTAVKMAQSEEHLRSIIDWPDDMVPVAVLGYSKPESQYEILDPGDLKTIRSPDSLGKVYQIETIESDEIAWMDAGGQEHEVVDLNEAEDVYCGYALADRPSPAENNYVKKMQLALNEGGSNVVIIWPDNKVTEGRFHESCLYLSDGDVHYTNDGVGDQLSSLAVNGSDPRDMMFLRYGERNDGLFKRVSNNPAGHASEFDNEHPIFLVNWNTRNKKVYLQKEDLGAIRSAKTFFDYEAAERGY